MKHTEALQPRRQFTMFPKADSLPMRYHLPNSTGWSTDAKGEYGLGGALIGSFSQMNYSLPLDVSAYRAKADQRIAHMVYHSSCLSFTIAIHFCISNGIIFEVTTLALLLLTNTNKVYQLEKLTFLHLLWQTSNETGSLLGLFQLLITDLPPVIRKLILFH